MTGKQLCGYRGETGAPMVTTVTIKALSESGDNLQFQRGGNFLRVPNL